MEARAIPAVNNDAVPVEKIDPTNMSAEQKSLLRAYFNHEKLKNARFFPQDVTYTFSPGLPRKPFKFKYSMASYPEGGFIFDLNKPVADGTYATVFKTEGFLDNDFVFQPKERAIKYQMHQDAGWYQELKKMYPETLSGITLMPPGSRVITSSTVICKLEHLKNDVAGSREAGYKTYTHPVYFPSKEQDFFYSFTSMEWLPGRELFEIIASERPKEAPQMTPELRLELTIQILKTYRQRILDKDIIHFDLKLENMKADIDELNVKIRSLHILDFAFSQKVADYNYQIFGSDVTISPEAIFKRPCTPFADIYSLGKLLAMVWGDDPPDGFDRSAIAKDWEFPNLFVALRGLYEEGYLKIIISSLLKSMCKLQPQERLNADPASESRFKTIKELVNFRLNKAIEKLTEMQLSRVKDVAFLYSECLNNIFINLTNENLSTPSPQELAKRLQKALITLLAKVVDEPHAIEYFIKQSKVAAFAGMQSKQQILSCMQSFVDFMIEASDLLEMRGNILSKSKAGEVPTQAEIAYLDFIDKQVLLNHEDFTFDNLNKLQKSLKPHLGELKVLFAAIEHKQMKQESDKTAKQEPAVSSHWASFTKSFQNKPPAKQALSVKRPRSFSLPTPTQVDSTQRRFMHRG